MVDANEQPSGSTCKGIWEGNETCGSPEVLDNGYCLDHQWQALKEVIPRTHVRGLREALSGVPAAPAQQPLEGVLKGQVGRRLVCLFVLASAGYLLLRGEQRTYYEAIVVLMAFVMLLWVLFNVLTLSVEFLKDVYAGTNLVIGSLIPALILACVRFCWIRDVEFVHPGSYRISSVLGLWLTLNALPINLLAGFHLNRWLKCFYPEPDGRPPYFGQGGQVAPLNSRFVLGVVSFAVATTSFFACRNLWTPNVQKFFAFQLPGATAVPTVSVVASATSQATITLPPSPSQTAILTQTPAGTASATATPDPTVTATRQLPLIETPTAAPTATPMTVPSETSTPPTPTRPHISPSPSATRPHIEGSSTPTRPGVLTSPTPETKGSEPAPDRADLGASHDKAADEAAAGTLSLVITNGAAAVTIGAAGGPRRRRTARTE